MGWVALQIRAYFYTISIHPHTVLYPPYMWGCHTLTELSPLRVSGGLHICTEGFISIKTTKRYTGLCHDVCTYLSFIESFTATSGSKPNAFGCIEIESYDDTIEFDSDAGHQWRWLTCIRERMNMGNTIRCVLYPVGEILCWRAVLEGFLYEIVQLDEITAGFS